MVSRRTRLWRWWHRRAVSLGVILLVIVGLLLVLNVLSDYSREDQALPGAGVLFFLLIPLNIIILCILALIIGRNIAKLVFDRRRGVLGSRLRTRLVVAFVGLIFIPTALLFWLASGLLNRALEGWFSSQIESAVDGAINVARLHYNDRKAQISGMSERIVRSLQVKPELYAPEDRSNLKKYLDQARTERGLFSLAVLDRQGDTIGESRSVADAIDILKAPPPNQSAIEHAISGDGGVFLESTDSGQFIRAYTPFAVDQVRYVLVLTYRTEPDLAHALAQVNDSFKDYQQLKLFKDPLKSGYLLTLSMITCLILFCAIWFAFYLARQMVEPIQRLAEGTRQIAKGNLDFEIRAGGDDEVGLLVQSFNQMTTDLKASRLQAEERRLYLETVLANLAVGVVALNRDRIVLANNQAAEVILGLKDQRVGAGQNSLVGKRLNDFEVVNQIQGLEQLISELDDISGGETSNRVLERELTISTQGRSSRVICTVGRIPHAKRGGEEVTVLILDDITELAKAQSIAAWREVARRIAHEIKNPLTPIQLSAQRIFKQLGEGPNRELVSECTRVIVENVDSIKRLADEFSKFSRMPSAELVLCDLNQLISETVQPFAQHSGSITFQFVAARDLPPVSVDREQLRRVLMNLIDNAVLAINQQPAHILTAFPGKIIVRGNYDPVRMTVGFEVVDNGPGVEERDKAKVFEPYFTKRAGGTGLGLAISASIIAEHRGKIRLYDNHPRGAKFVVEIPLSNQAGRAHRLVGTS